tara:strand:- start:186 stop:1067 length:882 start_codon:yes stop_codon:yes gene_type:complete
MKNTMINKLTVKRVLSKENAAKLKTKFLNKNHYTQLITEDTDGYDNFGNLLFRFRKNAIPLDVLKNGVDAFKGSIEVTEGRGTASGSSHKRIRKDGSVSNITVGNKVESGNVGFMDSGAMVKYCRKTAFARSYFDKFKQGVPFIEFIDQKYKELCPTHYAKQKAIAEGTNRNYVIGQTSFTTVTVNKNFRTACHQDAGDFADGFGNLIVYREGSYDGGYFVMPEYGVAIDLHNTDLLFADVHKWHANTEFTNCSDDWLRISFVMYYRENMVKCKSPSEELNKIKIEKTGYLTL